MFRVAFPHIPSPRARSGWLVLAACLLAVAATTPVHGQAPEPVPETPATAVAPEDPDAVFAGRVAALAEASFGEKRDIVDALTAGRHPHARELLAAFGDKRLFARESDGKVFIAVAERDDTLVLKDPLTLETAGEADEDDFDDVRTNNGLRKHIRGALARFDLDADDAATRAAAVTTLTDQLDAPTVAALRARLDDEPDDGIRDQIGVALAIADLDAESADTRLAAVERLKGVQTNLVYNRIRDLARTDSDGKPLEPDARVHEAAAQHVARIDSLRKFYGALETLFFGLSLGSVLVLAAIGLAITFGVMGVINMAHGELIMLGAYTTYVMQLLLPDQIGLAVLLAIPAAFVVSGLVGIAIERGVCRFLYGRPLETLLATFGLSLVLQQTVRSIFSPLNRSVATPDWMSGLIRFNDFFAITANRLYIVVFTLIVFALLMAVMQRTSLGLNVRAVSQNRQMARAMGIRSERVDALTFGLGSGIAGIAGVALSQLTNVGPNLGQSYIIDSFMVVVFGGVGNLWGTLVGGMTLGVLNKLLEPWSGAVLAKILVLVFLILFIQRRPRGLFPQKGRAAEG
ncbi:urea ABC transporter permease subunit UrtB [Algiphilus sp.]|uniref:urea ABC transporter permease subunit UrtB n=1 Tax=Algiphilus sp. TaxID=1872431 RepID=UPI0025C479B9|nr:urea ABC transporter permease subunit UrtB [Algiphilus sp.]MCK5768723.1 urea ABC transporter permease subunit UrtB [Algiphilus sp.]